MTTWVDEIAADPYRFDFFAVLRRLERSFPDKPRIGDAVTLREEYVRLGQNPYLAFPASNLQEFKALGPDRYRILVKFLGLMGPQGALPLPTTTEAYNWTEARDDSFARFCDLINNRFLQLFFRAWSDARPIGQHERPDKDRFFAYIGSTVGLGSPIYHGLDTVPDPQKLAHAGLMAPAAKSAVRLEALILGAIGLDADVYEFVGVRLPVAIEDQSSLGKANAGLGSEMMLGSSVYSVCDKFRIRIHAADLQEYGGVLPKGELAEPLVDLVYFYIGETLEWDVEIALPANKVEPMRLGKFGALGWTTWLNPKIDPEDKNERCDARFNLAERIRALRERKLKS